MKASYTVRPGLTVEVEGPTQKDLMREVAGAAEVFGESACGLCGRDAIMPIHRTVGEDEYFEWACLNPDCGARLSVGISKRMPGRLFPNRKLLPNGKPDWKAGTPGDHNGWTTYRGPDSVHDDDRPQQRTTPAPQSQPAKSAGNGGSIPPAKLAAAQQAQAAASATAAQPGTHTDPQSITREQWEEIRTALARHFIAPGAFLTRYGYKRPGQIPAAHFDEALAAARAPDEELRAVQKAGFGGKG